MADQHPQRRRSAANHRSTRSRIAPITALTALAAIAAALAACSLAACAGEEPAETTTTSGGSGGAGGASTFCTPGETTPCYTGPLATKEVGTCKSGQRTCNPEGTAFGVCVGEVTPVDDDCATPEDEDCDGTPAAACPGSHIASSVIGGTLDDQGRAIAVDAQGAMLVTGFFSGNAGMMSADFGGGPLTSGGGKDLFVAKLDASGKHVWSKGFGDDKDQEGNAIAVDSAGNVFVTGDFAGTLDLGGGKTLTASDNRDFFIIKLDPSGNVLWGKAAGDATGIQQGNAVAADPSGDVIVAGAAAGAIDLGGGPLTSAGGLDVFVAKLKGADGGHLWSKHAGDNLDQSARGVAVDASGAATITGGYKGVIDFGVGPLVSMGAEDGFIVKLGADGAVIFDRTFGDGGFDQSGQAVAIDGAGDILVAGNFKGEIDLGGGALMSAGAEDFFLAKLDGAGQHQWSRRVGDASSQLLQSIAVDAKGDIALTGKFTGSLDFGQKPVLPSTDVYDLFVAKLDPMGAHLWSYAFGGPFDQIGLGVAMDAGGEVAVTGNFFGSINLTGSGKKPSAGLSDLFVARFAP